MPYKSLDFSELTNAERYEIVKNGWRNSPEEYLYVDNPKPVYQDISTVPTPAKYDAYQMKKEIQPDTYPDWGNKVVWNSSDLAQRQLTLETYSAEVAMLFEAVRQIVVRSLDRNVLECDLVFTSNFGAPIRDNTQYINVMLSKPFDLNIMLYRRLVNGKLEWTADIGITEDTPIVVATRINKSKGNVPMDVITSVPKYEEFVDARPQRKVRL